MSKSYWLKEQKGNFSNEQEDTFEPKKRYVGIRLQQGVPLLDRDWNELEDIRRYEEVMLRKWYVGNGTPDDGFRINAVEPPTNDFRIAAGRCIVNGFEVVNDQVILYSQQDGVLDLNIPTTKRVDAVYLDVWIEEVTHEEEPALKNPQDVDVPTCVRHKLEWRVRVDEGRERHEEEDCHHYYYLAEIRWENEEVIEVKDQRTTKLTLASVKDELEYVRLCRVPLLQQTIFGRAVPVATVAVGESPYGVAFDGAHIWVANQNGSVSKIAILSNEVVATVAVGELLTDVAFDGAHIWVANYTGNSVSKIDILTNTVTATVAVGGHPYGVAFDGAHIWVANYADSSVSKIAILSNEVVATVAVGGNPHGVAFDGAHIWVANYADSSVSKIDIFTNTVEATVDVGNGPWGVAFDGAHIWVSNLDDRSVSKIDILTDTVKAIVPVGGRPWGVAFDGAHIWVANLEDRNVSKIDILTDTVKAIVPVGSNPRGVAFDGAHIWVANYIGRSVSKILRGDLR